MTYREEPRHGPEKTVNCADAVMSPAATDYPHEAKRHVEALISSMETLLARDPDQEVDSIAISDVEGTLPQ